MLRRWRKAERFSRRAALLVVVVVVVFVGGWV
jgi:hypothetical protein